MVAVPIQVEIASSFPAKTVFKVSKDLDIIAPKINPSACKSVETIQGNGSVGTIKLLTFGESVPFTSVKYKVDAFDEGTLSYSYTFFEGDNLKGILDSITQHVKIVPSGDGGSIFKQTIIYNCKGDEKPSEEFLKTEKDMYERIYKKMEAYGVAHPELY